jgi:aryl-alcohol dehydrogenase-like predicted oxidoreductase
MALDHYVTLGRSGLRVSPLCLGAMTFGEDLGWGTSVEESQRIMDRFIELGGNFIDTANFYTRSHSEKIIGDHLGRHSARRDRLVIATKFSGNLYPGDPNGGGSGRKSIIAAAENSLRRLQTDYIDLYWLHNWDMHTPIEETMAALDDLVRSGKVRYIGGSTMPAYKFAQMVMIADWKGYARPIAMQNLYNLIQREEEREMNRLCDEQGVGLIPYSPLARGFLAGNRSKDGGGSTERSKNDTVVKDGTYRDSDWEIVKRLKKIAKEKGATPAQVALAWLLHKPYMGAPIIGATDLDQLTSAAKSTGIALTPEESKLLEQPYEFRVSPEN